MNLYLNQELTEPVSENTAISFGVVRAGSHKDKKIYIHNDTDALLTDIRITFHSPEEPEEPDAVNDIKAVMHEVNIKSNETGVAVIRWTPQLTLRKPLETLIRVYADELYM